MFRILGTTNPITSSDYKSTMQITIDLPQDLEEDPIRQASQSNIPLQTLIIQALRQLTLAEPSKVSQWSDIVLSYKGMPDFPAFESYRDELSQREFERVPRLQTENWRQS
jgi:hypothetical protein